MSLLFRVAVVLLYLQTLLTADCPGVVDKKGWGALNPNRVQYLIRPVNIVVIQHTASKSCSTDESCGSVLRGIQKYQMVDLKYWDISSTFYVGGNGKIYEGRGWLHIGAHTYGYNDKSIGISFIGNYNDVEPTNLQLDAVKNLLKCGVREGHLTQEYRVVGHKQLSTTESPGRKLYSVIQKWPEWVNNINSVI